MADVKMLFLDVNNTVSHPQKCDGMFSTGDEEFYITSENLSLLKQISEKIPVFVVSGRRHSRFQSLHNLYPFCSAIIEHGCLIFEKDKMDAEYFSRFFEYAGELGKKQGLLWDFERMLNSQGIKTDSVGRVATFRVLLDGWTKEQKNDFLAKKLPFNLQAVENVGHIDIIPPMGGKEKAVDFLLNKYKTEWSKIVCMGDSASDANMLAKSGFSVTHSMADQKVLNLLKNPGYLSPFKYHEAAADMLKHVLSMVKV